MLVTEKEAAERWCPFAKTQVLQTDTDGTVHGASVNRTFLPAPSGNMSDLVAGTQCIGSRCMAWREYDKGVGPQIGIQVPEGRFEPFDKPSPTYGPVRGYCGAFGKVEP